MTPFEPDHTGATAGPLIDPSIPPAVAAFPVSPAASAPSAPSARRTIIRSGLLGVALAATFGAGVGIGRIDLPAAPAGAATATPGASLAPGEDFTLVKEAWDAIHENYVDAADLDDRELAYAAIDGLTEAVGDTGHTDFMTPEERASRNSSLSGSYVGIGAAVDETPEGLPLIVGVFRGSPADEAGLNVGDVVLAVDGDLTAGDDLDSVIGRVRGEAGTTVVLTIRSGADGPEREIRIVRADVKIEPVSWVMVPDTKLAILRLEQFSSGAGPKLTAALQELKAAGAESLILDLRGNPGGYVNEAVVVASQFLGTGNVYIERNAAGEEKATAVAAGGVALDIPLTVLVDGGTASAAEIVAGALQDAGRAHVLGETTFGTGTVLGEFALADGSALRIGTVEWLTPTGRVIWHEGITPDELVERPAEVPLTGPDDIRGMSQADIAGLEDQQLARAIELAEAT